MGTKTTSIPTPGSFGNQDSNGTFTDNQSYGFPENGWVDAVHVYTGNNSGSINLVFGVYRTDTGALIGQTTQGSASSGKVWRSLGFNLASNANNYPGGYNSPNLYIWSGYGWSAGTWGSGAQNIGIDTSTGGFYHLTSGSIATSRANGGLNPFGNAGRLYYYLEYFPSCTISAITAGPTPPGGTVTITGVSFTAGINSDGIVFNGNGSGAVNASSWTVVSDTQLNVTVPTGATTGTVTVNTKAGAATSSSTQISNGYVYNGTSWVGVPIYVNNGTSNVSSPIKVWNGSAWVQIG